MTVTVCTVAVFEARPGDPRKCPLSVYFRLRLSDHRKAVVAARGTQVLVHPLLIRDHTRQVVLVGRQVIRYVTFLQGPLQLLRYLHQHVGHIRSATELVNIVLCISAPSCGAACVLDRSLFSVLIVRERSRGTFP